MIQRKCGRVRLARELLARPDRRMVLLVPFQILFGAMSALLIVYVNGNIVKSDIGTDAIGYFTMVEYSHPVYNNLSLKFQNCLTARDCNADLKRDQTPHS